MTYKYSALGKDPGVPVFSYLTNVEVPSSFTLFGEWKRLGVRKIICRGPYGTTTIWERPRKLEDTQQVPPAQVEDTRGAISQVLSFDPPISAISTVRALKNALAVIEENFPDSLQPAAQQDRAQVAIADLSLMLARVEGRK